MEAIPSYVFLMAILALLALAGGLGIWLYNYITGEGMESKKQEQPSPPKRMSLTQVQDVAETDEQELLSVYRMDGGELAVFVQGLRYQHLREIRDPQLGKETITAIKRVLEFAEGWLPALRQEPSAPPLAAPTLSAAPTAPSVDEVTFLSQLRQADIFPQEPPPTSLFARRPRKSKTSKPPLPMSTPADEIDKLVQERIKDRPDIPHGSLSVATAADGGLSIHVGLQTFTQVDSIPDPQVRAIIQDAIREWKES